MPDYSKAKIYKIYSYENDDVYYGSTCETLSRRMSGHRGQMKLYKEGKCNYTTSFKILELTSAKIELVENYPCNSKEELLQREGYYIRNNNCVNKQIAGRTKKEYHQQNKEHINEWHKEYNKQYHQENKEHIKEYNKQYHQENKEHIKEQKKEYYQQNKEHIKEQKKEYRQENKEHIKEQKKEYNKAYRQRKKEQALMLKENTNIKEI